MIKAAVIGANGFLGANLISDLLYRGFKVWGFYKNNYDSIPGNCIKIHAEKIAETDIYFDYLFISIGNHSLNKEAFEIQYDFLNTILQYLKFSRVVYVSSVSVYGNHKELITEESVFNQPSLYGLAKIAEEQLIFKQQCFAVIRFTYLYGIGMRQNSLIPILCKKAKSDGVISIYGDGSRSQDYLEIADAVSLLVKSALSKENLLLIGATGKSVSNKDVALTIADCIPGVRIEYTGEDNASSFYYDIKKTYSKLGWRPLISFTEGINKLINNGLTDL